MATLEAPRSLAGQKAIKIGVKLKFLGKEDKPRVKELCRKFFPIDYPEKWYDDVTSDKKYFALSAVYRNILVGVIIAEVKPRLAVNADDSDILAANSAPESKVAYLLSLGVLDEYRENGIGSLLMDSLLTEVKGKEKSCIKAVYLHVLCSNLRAIQFYERRDFVLHKRISGYYNINKKIEDGYCYVRYINGGQPPWSVTDYMKHVTSMLTKFNSCSATSHHHHHHSKESKEVSSKPSKANCNHTGAQSSFAAPLPASVHSYTSIVLNKLPKLLPSGLPKISSLFSHINSSSPPKHNATHPEQGSADNQSDKPPSPVSSNYSSTQEDPDEELGTDVTKLNVDNLSPPIRINAWQTTTSCDQDYPPHLTTGSEMDLSLTRSASLSGSEEFHDSMSSLSQLHSLQDHDEISDSLTESDFLHMPTSRFTTATVLEETKETHKLSSGIRIPNAVKQNPVSSLISSTINQKLKLKAPFQNAYSHHKSNGLTSSKSSSAFAKTHTNSQHGTASSGGWSTTKKAVRVKSALTKSLAKIKPTSNNFLEDEEVLNSTSGSELGDLTNRVF